MSLEHDAEAAESATEEPMADTSVDNDTETESVETTEEPAFSGLNRRGMLLSGGLLGLLGLGVGSASADASGQVGTDSDPLTDLHTEKLNGILMFMDGGEEGDVLQYAGGGNSLSPQPIEVNNLISGQQVGLEVGPGKLGFGPSKNQPPNLRAGHEGNEINSNSYGVSILGGGASTTDRNEIYFADLSSVVGGLRNHIQGVDNNNKVEYSTILGGRGNTVSSSYSVAGGRKADTNDHKGVFVWGDSTDTTVTATAEDQVRFQAGGGFVVEDNVRTVTRDTTANPGETVIADTSSGTITVTLPSAVNGAQIILKCGGPNNLNVLTENSEQIDGYSVDNTSNPYVLVDGGARTLVSDGTNYFEVGKTSGRPDPSA